jgi:hypothetical protein
MEAMEQLNFETVPAAQVAGLGTNDETIERARVPGGWIVIYDQRRRVGFYPDSLTGDNLGPNGTPTQRENELRLVA